MLVQQHTIKKPVTMTGVGLHTGVQTTMTFKPAPENYGIRFRRVDVGGNRQQAARLQDGPGRGVVRLSQAEGGAGQRHRHGIAAGQGRDVLRRGFDQGRPHRSVR